MTPLEIARKNQEELKTKPPCCKCPKSERVGNALFCAVTGKMILPQHEHLCLCKGERLKRIGEWEMNKTNEYLVVYFYANNNQTGVGRTTVYVENETPYTTEKIKEIETNICKECKFSNAVIINIIPLESEETKE